MGRRPARTRASTSSCSSATITSPNLDALRSIAGSSGLLLDFDGTLSEIAPRPELAVPVEGAPDAVTAAAEAFGLVAIVSGRPTAEVAALLGVEGVRYEGCYGLESPAAASEVVDEISAAVRAIEGTIVEAKGASVAVHYRGAADPSAARDGIEPALAKIANRHGLEVIEGKMVLELVPAGIARKGGVVERLSRDLRGVLYAGDDTPDLEAFAALDASRERGLVTVKVAVRGPETPDELVSAADLVVSGPRGLVELLREIVRDLTGR